LTPQNVFQLQRVCDNSSARRATTAASRRPLQVSKTWRLHCHWAQDLLQDWLLVLCWD
jgi:hypothetical protein